MIRNIFPVVSLSILAVMANISIHTSKDTFSKIYYTLCIYFFWIFLWIWTDNHLLLCIVFMILSFINFLVAYKRLLKGWKHTLFVLLFCMFFMAWLTVLFGKYYFEANLIDIVQYNKQLNEIINKEYFFVFQNLLASFMFFDIGVRIYYPPPKVINLSNPFFIQFFLGWIINGTIIVEIFTIIRKTLFATSPDKSKDDTIKMIDY